MNKKNVLLVEDDQPLRESIEKFLKKNGFGVVEARSVKTAAEMIDREEIDLMIVDLTLPDGNGMEIVDRYAPEFPARIIVLTGTGNIEKSVHAMKAGAFDFLEKPVNPDILLLSLQKAAEFMETTEELTFLKKEVATGLGFDKFLFKSKAMERLIQLAHIYAASDQPVLITGETGTGKELMAQAIQKESPRRNNAYLSVNCASIPDTLAESELFGYKQGAFTGAYKSYPGKFLLADKGTLVLDEIAELPMTIQAKLLRVLESGEIMPLKGSRSTQVDVRVIAMTNKNLEIEMRQQRFRPDLFYRIDGLNLTIPPLRERREDILYLAEHFFHVAGIANSKPIDGISTEARELLCDYPWPGNVRELKNTIFRIAVTLTGRIIQPEDLPMNILNRSGKAPLQDELLDLAQVERNHIIKVVDRTGNNLNKASRLLGISRSSLYRKLKQYDRFRNE